MRIVSAVIVALFAVIMFGLIRSEAHAAELSHPSPTHVACADFKVWATHHKPTHHLTVNRALTVAYNASKHANATVKTDIVVVYTEVRQNDWFDVSADTHATLNDCKGK